MKTYIHQLPGWPNFSWDHEALIYLLGNVRNTQGKLLGKMESLGFDFGNEAVLETLTIDVLKSSEIEGEILQANQIRSSLARHLGMDISGLVASDRNVDGVVEMMLDATQNFEEQLTQERLFAWHSSLFPGGNSGMHKIITGNWRDDSSGPMQVVSGALGKERVHFQAPPASAIEKEISSFLVWFNNEENLDPVIKAAVAHFWFVTIHPFEDGNGRIARTITDMLLARSDKSSQRFYSMSAQIRLDRKQYYSHLEKTQKGSLDITDWLFWFLNCLLSALTKSDETQQKVLFKSQFWKTNSTTILNDRQILIINKLLNDFFGKLSSSKYAKIAKCSTDTALRDIQDLIKKEVLIKKSEGGRSTNYGINENMVTR